MFLTAERPCVGLWLTETQKEPHDMQGLFLIAKRLTTISRMMLLVRRPPPPFPIFCQATAATRHYSGPLTLLVVNECVRVFVITRAKRRSAGIVVAPGVE